MILNLIFIILLFFAICHMFDIHYHSIGDNYKIISAYSINKNELYCIPVIFGKENLMKNHPIIVSMPHFLYKLSGSEIPCKVALSS